MVFVLFAISMVTSAFAVEDEFDLNSIVLKRISPAAACQKCEARDSRVQPTIIRRTSGVDRCSDLFNASCMDENGNMKESLGLADEMEKIIEQGYLKTLKRQGYDSVEAALTAHMKSNGFEINPKLENPQKKLFFSGNLSGDVRIEEFISNAPNNCDRHSFQKEMKSETKRLKQSVHDNATELENARARGMPQKRIKALEETLAAAEQKLFADLRSEISRAGEISKKYTDRDRILHQLDFVSIYTEILAFCPANLPVTITEKKEEYAKAVKKAQPVDSKEKPNVAITALKVPEACSNNGIYSIRRKILEIHRNTDPAKAIRSKSKFVNDNFEFLLLLRRLDFQVNGMPVTVNKEEIAVQEKLEMDANSAFELARQDCVDLSKTHSAAVKEEYRKFFRRLAGSRPFVEYISDTAYSADNKQSVSAIFKKAHAGVTYFVTKELGRMRGLKWTRKLSRMKRELKRLSLTWNQKPPARYYKASGTLGIETLDFDAVPEHDGFANSFQDHALTHFRNINAYYAPMTQTGAFRQNETVSIMPVLFPMAAKNPYALLMIMAHEIGHKFGLRTSGMNGYDLSGHYGKLVSCLMGAGSIRINNKQADEAIADWIAAKVVGSVLMSLPAGERKNAALKLSGFFCETEGSGFLQYSPFLKASHPDAVLRVNGIFGANSDVRRALGCAHPGMYKECTLAGEAK